LQAEADPVRDTQPHAGSFFMKQALRTAAGPKPGCGAVL
jgi:hypothetical protein